MYNLELDTSTEVLELDDYYTLFDMDLPKSNYKMNAKMGNGGFVTGNGALDARVIKVSRIFSKHDEPSRQKFLKWFTKPTYQNVYLRRNTSSFNGISQIYPALAGGESFKVRNFNFGSEISFLMYMPDPFFQSTAQSNSTFVIATTFVQGDSITITNAMVFPEITFTSSGVSWDSFDFQLTENYGFHIDNNFTSTQTIIVYTTGSNLKLTIDGNEAFGLFTLDSTPFELVTGENQFYVIGASGKMNIKYYERSL